MFPKTSAIAALTASAFLVSGTAIAAAPKPDDFVGKRLTVDVEQLLYYKNPSKSYNGSLQRGESFKVSRFSPSGVYAYGFAYGRVNKVGWVRTSGLDEKSSAAAGGSGPRVIGTPSARYVFAETDAGRGRFLSIAAVFRTDRVLDRDVSATVAGPRLRPGQTLFGALFGSTTPSRIGQTSKHCYVGEITQLRRHPTLSEHSWKFGLRSNGQVVGLVKNIKLKRQATAPSGGGQWELVAAERLGC